MTNGIIIEIDKQRKLRFDFNAMSDAEYILNMTFPQILGNLGFRTARALLWAGLRHEDDNLTLRQAGQLAEQWMQQSNGNIADLMEVIETALVQGGWMAEKKQVDDTVQKADNQAQAGDVSGN